jgi:chromosome partitioning protein
MGNIYVFVNQKGGVGKTTSAINIGAFLAEEGKRVLLVDFDSQANLSSGIGLAGTKPSIYELISEDASLADTVKPTSVPNLSAISANIDLSGAAVELIKQEQRYFFLKNALEPARPDYDYILIDCPPSLGILTINGLVAADHVLIPMQCEYFALEGLSLLLQTIKRVNNLNPSLDIGGIFFTMFDSRIKLNHEVVRQVNARFHKQVFNNVAPRNVRLSEAPSYGQPISIYDPQCAGAKAYRKLAQELIQRG